MFSFYVYLKSLLENKYLQLFLSETKHKKKK